MADMANLVRRLDSVMNKLMETSLYKNHDISDESVQKFEQILNSAIPLTEFDKNVGEIVRYMYGHNKSSWIKYMYINQFTSLALLTDGYLIVKVLKLKGVVYIRWDRTAGNFDVRPISVGEAPKKLMDQQEYTAAMEKIKKARDKVEVRKKLSHRRPLKVEKETKNKYVSDNKYAALEITMEPDETIAKKSWADICEEEEQ